METLNAGNGNAIFATELIPQYSNISFGSNQPIVLRFLNLDVSETDHR